MSYSVAICKITIQWIEITIFKISLFFHIKIDFLLWDNDIFYLQWVSDFILELCHFHKTHVSSSIILQPYHSSIYCIFVKIVFVKNSF